MSWIAVLDARAHQWRSPLPWLYLGLKWGLILLGAFALTGVLLDRFGIWRL